MGDGIFTQDGAAWKHSRDLLRPQFSKQQYQDLDIFKEHVESLVANIPGDGEIIDLQPLFFRFTLDTTSAFLFGESTHTLGNGRAVDGQIPANGPETDGQRFANSFDTAQDYVVKRFRLLDLYWLIGGPKFHHACDLAHKFIDGIIMQQGASTGNTQEKRNKYLFFDAVADTSPTKEALRGQLLNILLAGRDTTACLLSWTFHLLARHPEVLSKLRAEIYSVAGIKTDMTTEELRRMPYLAKVLKESRVSGAIEVLLDSS